jgi:hypothetical protein
LLIGTPTVLSHRQLLPNQAYQSVRSFAAELLRQSSRSENAASAIAVMNPLRTQKTANDINGYRRRQENLPALRHTSHIAVSVDLEKRARLPGTRPYIPRQW